MTAGQVAENQSGSQGAAVSAVGHAHDGAHRVARGVQTLDHAAVDVERPPLRIRARPAFGAERPAPNAYGIVGRAVDQEWAPAVCARPGRSGTGNGGRRPAKPGG